MSGTGERTHVSDTPMVVNGHLLVEVRPGELSLSPLLGHIVVHGGRVVHVDAARASPACDLGGEGCILSPGFVDAHLHLPQFNSIGIDGLELLDWLDRVIFPAELRWNDLDFAKAQASAALHELLSFGTTGIAAYATSNAAAAQAAIMIAGRLGVAGCIGQVLMDRGGPQELLVAASHGLSQASGLRACGRVAPAVTPRFALSCSPQLLEGAGKLARKTGWMIQTHLAETLRECEAVAATFGDSHLWGGSYTSIYDRAGLLTSKSLLGHGIYLSSDEARAIAAAGATVAHCPTANRFLDAGAMNLHDHTTSGVAIAIGSDVGAGPDRSMVRVARGMMDTAKQTRRAKVQHDVQPISAAAAWWQITAGNAARLGLAETGAIAADHHADVVVIRPSKPWQESLDPLASLLYSWDDRWIETVLASGRLAYSAAHAGQRAVQRAGG